MDHFNDVFLIDDDPISNMLHKRVIEVSFFSKNTRSFTDANEAISKLKKCIETGSKFPDVIFLDIEMPKMDGWEFLEELNKFPEAILKKCKVFMLTSSINKSDIEKSKTFKIVLDFIFKPLSVKNLETISAGY